MPIYIYICIHILYTYHTHIRSVVAYRDECGASIWTDLGDLSSERYETVCVKYRL